mmetsp:Transcript_6449/g.24187  ORF Transcript_6449/g.24187 Transcript_6449/m.24187 type:complete len:108 (-) Transcript_6449:327-650(-)
MRTVAAYLLAVLGGNTNPQKADIQKILKSVSADASDEQIDLLLKELSGKNIEDVISEGSEKLATVPVGGAGGAPAAGGAAPAEEAKVEEPEESSSESDADMGLGLFG